MLESEPTSVDFYLFVFIYGFSHMKKNIEAIIFILMCGCFWFGPALYVLFFVWLEHLR